MIPSRLLLWLVVLWAALGFAAGWFAVLVELWWAAGALLLVLAAGDAKLGRQVPKVRLERTLNGVWPLGQWREVALTLHHEGGRPLRFSLFDGYPTAWEMDGLPHGGQLMARRFLTFRYRLRPLARGDETFSAAHVRVESPLRLWQRQVRWGESQRVKVFPDFARVLGHNLIATDQRVPQAGTLRKRQRGEGTDFHQLREYRIGDSLRSIDWKATARQQKPISREYQEERDQQVVFLLDSGRRMLARDGELAHFDHALNAMLLLAWVAQKQGDAVGLMTFGAETRWLPPQKGRVGLDRLLAGVYDLQPSEVAPDYALAAEALLGRLRKRAFVVLLTNLRDEDDQALAAAVRLLSRKHLVLCASLRESALDAVLETPVTQFNEALRLAATHDYLTQRSESSRRLGLRGGMLLDVTPDQLPAALVDRYHGIKDAGVL
ncbi:Uncharacterized conserved protein, DUF58 family, contains vWF domain [Formivibrio citricus]|uniref:Uncharacterized conserved protein, DUF58 family, contains vWF domain n=1 Tax=Formivibrio citricus TaxID=83765 RepID=A0A1I4ZC91_9NEIS|nr:DUF58 domain-containing protein [Formivibrio citricus]SFN47643.1 Uncharacterized conserved protein, DUF58 family, contains vWF domain [Formivibrio citricus]